MLEQLEDHIITPSLMNQLGRAYENKDVAQMYITATNFKSACLRLGASHLYYYCKQIEINYKRNEMSSVLVLYADMVECIISTKILAMKML
jgi:HPt (histidine-containing phosphotransfer) domain-containing protein